jgi:hypothetical protein
VFALNRRPGRLQTAFEILRAAVGALGLDDCDALVIASPHGRATGVYSRVSGSLDAFGVRNRSVGPPTDDGVTEELANEWGRPLLEPPVDHGIVGTLLLSGRSAAPSVVASAFATVTGPDAPAQFEAAVEAAGGFADAVSRVSAGRRIGFVASAHTSAALSPAAPLLDRPEGHELEERVLAALRRDSAALAGIEPELWRAAGACGAGPLTAFGRLFAGRRAEVLAYEAPAGVGYLVAQVVKP